MLEQTLVDGSEHKEERVLREVVSRERKLICDKIHKIEMIYKESSRQEQKEYDKKLRNYGKMLEKLVLPRRSLLHMNLERINRKG